jgi:hypothetical protein
VVLFPNDGCQCVTAATAGGAADAITLPRLPCIPTTTLLILKIAQTNATTAPTIQPQGLPAQTVTRFDGTHIQPGDLAGGSYVLLLNNGSNWLLLTIEPGTPSLPPSIALPGTLTATTGVVGSLTVTGGAAIGETLTAATINAGSATISGNLAVGENVYVGGSASIAGNLTVGGTISAANFP